jgi:SAM-dependent methyltransferase
MAVGDGESSIGAAVGESWLSTLEVNAAFDRPWVESAVAWLLDGGGSGSGNGSAGDLRVVDVGCGAGGAACAFGQRPEVGGVVAVDRDPRLVAVGRRRAAAEGIADRVRWACGEVARLALPPGSADLVWASGVIHHVADQQAAVDELARLLRPGGVLALVEGGLPLRCLPHDVGIGRPGLEARLDEARARWFEDLRAELDGPPLPYGWPAALARSGLADVRTRSYLAESTSPLDTVGRRIARQHLESARDELGGRLDPDDRATLQRLLDPADPADVAALDRRDDLTVTAVRTVHAATRPAA